MSVQSDWAIQLEDALECYNLAAEPDDEDENPHSVNIPESEGTRDVDDQNLRFQLSQTLSRLKRSILAQKQNQSLPLLETIGMMKL